MMLLNFFVIMLAFSSITTILLTAAWIHDRTEAFLQRKTTDKTKILPRSDWQIPVSQSASSEKSPQETLVSLSYSNIAPSYRKAA